MQEKSPTPDHRSNIIDKLNEVTAVRWIARVSKSFNEFKDRILEAIKNKEVRLTTIEELTGLKTEEIDSISLGLSKKINGFIEKVRNIDFETLEEVEEEMDNFDKKIRGLLKK